MMYINTCSYIQTYMYKHAYTQMHNNSYNTHIHVCDPIHLWCTIILKKCLLSNTRYSAILDGKPMKFGIQEDLLMLLLDTKFSWLSV